MTVLPKLNRLQETQKQAYRLSPQSLVSKDAQVKLWGVTTHIQAKGNKFPWKLVYIQHEKITWLVAVHSLWHQAWLCEVLVVVEDTVGIQFLLAFLFNLVLATWVYDIQHVRYKAFICTSRDTEPTWVYNIRHVRYHTLVGAVLVFILVVYRSGNKNKRWWNTIHTKARVSTKGKPDPRCTPQEVPPWGYAPVVTPPSGRQNRTAIPTLSTTTTTTTSTSPTTVTSLML